MTTHLLSRFFLTVHVVCLGISTFYALNEALAKNLRLVQSAAGGGFHGNSSAFEVVLNGSRRLLRLQQLLSYYALHKIHSSLDVRDVSGVITCPLP